MFGIIFTAIWLFNFNYAYISCFPNRARSNSNKSLLLITFCILSDCFIVHVSRHPESMPLLVFLVNYKVYKRSAKYARVRLMVQVLIPVNEYLNSNARALVAL